MNSSMSDKCDDDDDGDDDGDDDDGKVKCKLVREVSSDVIKEVYLENNNNLRIRDVKHEVLKNITRQTK